MAIEKDVIIYRITDESLGFDAGTCADYRQWAAEKIVDEFPTANIEVHNDDKASTVIKRPAKTADYRFYGKRDVDEFLAGLPARYAAEIIGGGKDV